ncbi:4'-phosphopantetheinyl transferase family protein [Methanobrevibacter woesei]|uniref:4'-phosphopantetheinyl transferase family protein n=1 Tax=Methanobrevibacter woesei TaxID=190976 RepID=UPI00255BCB88|nr:4'-phosphopantetheinyl transferase superfamily protein [Methanobrevibacter woesei]
MIKIAYTDVSNLNLDEIYYLLPKSRRNKVDSFKFERDKQLSAGAYLLLNKLLKEEDIIEPNIKLKKFGKAYITNYENIYFNISHSNKLVVCGISDKEIGVDIENIDSKIDLNIAKHYFYNSEYENIMNSKNPSDEFFKYWVLKESYMKYTGLGFNLKLDGFEIIMDDRIHLKNNKKLRFNLFNINSEYKISVCSHYNINKLIKINLLTSNLKKRIKK